MPGGNTMERKIVKKAIGTMKKFKFACMPMPEREWDKEYKFEETTLAMVAKAGCRLEWLETCTGGCWYVIPIE